MDCTGGLPSASVQLTWGEVLVSITVPSSACITSQQSTHSLQLRTQCSPSVSEHEPGVRREATPWWERRTDIGNRQFQQEINEGKPAQWLRAATLQRGSWLNHCSDFLAVWLLSKSWLLWLIFFFRKVRTRVNASLWGCVESEPWPSCSDAS